MYLCYNIQVQRSLGFFFPGLVMKKKCLQLRNSRVKKVMVYINYYVSEFARLPLVISECLFFLVM